MSDPTLKQLAAEIDSEDKYHALLSRIDELAAYAHGLDDARDIRALVVSLRDDQQQLIKRLFDAFAYGEGVRKLYTKAEAQLTDLKAAIAKAAADDPDVAALLKKGEGAALTGLITRMSAAWDVNPSVIARLLEALEKPDAISPYHAGSTAAALRDIAAALETQAILEEEKTA